MKVFGRLLTVATVALSLAVFTVNKADAYAFNPWTTMTGDKTIAVNPFFNTSGFVNGSTVGFTPATPLFSTVFEMGIGANADFFVSTAGWGMGRIQLVKDVAIVALYADASVFGPQYHGVFSFGDSFLVEANAYLNINYAFNSYTIGAYIAPTIKFGDMAAYVEIDPTVSFAGGTTSLSLSIVPGIALGNGMVSIGLPISIPMSAGGSLTVGIGAWLWIPYTVK